MNKKVLNRVVVNTRPISQSNQTNQEFIKQGFDVINFPCIEIVASDDSQKCINQLNEINDKGIILFTSQNAVIYAFKLKPNWHIPQESKVIAVGTKTAEYLEQHINNCIFVPEQQNSQGVIEILNGLKDIPSISLISAENGRQEIQTYAKVNNIELNQINVYKRQIPKIIEPINWINNNSEINILATSINVLENLKLLVGKNQWKFLKNQLIVCASNRIEKRAHELGLLKTLNINSANPEIMAQKLREYFQQQTLS